MDKALAIEENGVEFLMAFGRAAGAEVRDDGRMLWAIGNSPIDYFNCVAYAGLTGEEAEREITASIEQMQAHDVPGSWHVGPSMRTSDLGAPPRAGLRVCGRRHRDGGGPLGAAG